MEKSSGVCPKCNRKIMQNISNRCMYCGVDLPEEFQLTSSEKSELLAQKLERFKETEENADQIISNMRKDFAIPEKRKSGKQKKADGSDVVAAAIASLNTGNQKRGDGNN